MVRISLVILALWLSAPQAHAFDDNWREDNKALLEEKKPSTALHNLEKVGNEARFLRDDKERIDTLRFLGELYWIAGKKPQAREFFTRAMKESLDLERVWERLSVAISVLELQESTITKPRNRTTLLQQTLDSKLLPASAKDRHASEIGRYIRQFNGMPRTMFVELLDQIRHIKMPTIRKKALFKITEIEMDSNKVQFLTFTDTAPFEADHYEKFLWASAVARLYNTPSSTSNARRFKQQMQRLYLRLDKKQKTQARRIMKRHNLSPL